jgi:hypothetical protein
MGLFGTLFGDSNPAGAVGSAAGAGIVKMFTGVMDEIRLSPEAKAELTQKLSDNQAALAKMETDYDAKLKDVAGQNIRAETTSSDKYTSRARPTFMYIIEAALAMNFVVIPIFGVFAKLFHGPDISPISLPADVLTLFGVCITGYIGARSVDKALALPGETSVNVLGIKASNKQ